jgi:hypothetical protein
MRKALPLVALGLVLCLVFILNVDHKQQEKAAAEVLALEEQLRPLNVKRQQLKQQIENLADEYQAARRPKATTQILFTELDPRVYEVCFPIMKEREITGLLALSSKQLPGEENCMKVEQFEQLLEEGWSVCVRFDDSARLSTQWTSLKKQLKKLNIEEPTTVYFPKEIYKSNLDATIEKCGFQIVIHQGEENKPLVQEKDEKGLWHLGAVGLKGKEPRIRFMDAINKKGNIITLVGFTLEEEMYMETSFTSLLDSCKDYERKEELLIGSPEDARLHFQNRTDEAGEVEKQEYLANKAELEAKLIELEKQIQELQK